MGQYMELKFLMPTKAPASYATAAHGWTRPYTKPWSTVRLGWMCVDVVATEML
jgi:hypothetical protein